MGPRDKHDGCRLQVRRVGDTVRLFTRRGNATAIRVCAFEGRMPPPECRIWRNCVNREIDSARMPSRDIKLHNVNHCAQDHRPDA